MKLKLFIAAATMVFAQSAMSKQMLCRSGSQKVLLLEGGYAKFLGLDFAGLSSAATWRCAGVAGADFGWFSSATHFCYSMGAMTTVLHTNTAGSVATVQLYNGFGFPIFNAPCVLQNN